MLAFSVDPSINTIGWVYCFIGSAELDWHERVQVIRSGCINIKNKDDAPIAKMNFIFHELDKIISNINIDIFICEEILSNANAYSSILLCKAQAILISVAIKNKIATYVCSCKTARKLVLSNGNAQKKEVKEFLMDKTGVLLKNYHIYDAFLLVFAFIKRGNAKIKITKKKTRRLS